MKKYRWTVLLLALVLAAGVCAGCGKKQTDAPAQDNQIQTNPDEVTAVTFRSLSSAEICAYIATGEPMDKAGAYGIQGRGALFVEGIEGDYYNVMGLPVCRLGRILARLGVDCARLWSEL